MATLAIFDWPGAVKNACWGASPNPALWDKMSQRGWLCHRRCHAGSLFTFYHFLLILLITAHNIVPNIAPISIAPKAKNPALALLNMKSGENRPG